MGEGGGGFMARTLAGSVTVGLLATSVAAAGLPSLRLAALDGRLRVEPPEDLARGVAAETAEDLPDLAAGEAVRPALSTTKFIASSRRCPRRGRRTRLLVGVAKRRRKQTPAFPRSEPGHETSRWP
jgi:hypothetical protein